MTLSEKVAYLRGLKTGLNLNQERPETKLFNGILDVLDDIALSMDETNVAVETLQDQVLEVDSDLGSLESMLYFSDAEEWDDDEDEDEKEEEEDDADSTAPATDAEPEDKPVEKETETYAVECPGCATVMQVTEAELLKGSMVCPGCGETLEFELELDEE